MVSNPYHNKNDSSVKSPLAVLRCALPRLSAGRVYSGVLLYIPHSSGLAHLASGAFYCAVSFDDFSRVHQK